MPSADKVTKLESKLEVIPTMDPKASEIGKVSQESDQNNGQQNNSKEPVLPIQQGLQVIQNKIRNLEKRKNKLDGYIKEEEEGRELSDAQKNALEKYDEVANQLAISKEFAKQLQAIVTQSSKDAKRDAKKAQHIRMVQEQTKVREVIVVQDILKQLKNESVRNDFLQGSNKACLVEAAEMNLLEQFSKHTTPVHPNFSNEPSFFSSAKTAADHLHHAVDGKNRQFLETGFTYEKIKELFSRIEACEYWKRNVVEVPSTSPTSMTQERPAESETPQSSDDLESKEDKIDLAEMKITSSAPLPTQVPNPTQLFNGGANPMMAHHQQQHHAVPMHQVNAVQQSQQQQQIPMKPVTAVENAYYNQMKYSQHQQQGPAGMNNNNCYLQDFATSNFSFLQDSEIEQQKQQQQQQQQAVHVAANSQAQQPKIPPNFVSQPKHSPVQANAVQPNLSSFHQQPTQTHHYPPGLKLQQNTNNIPVNYSQASQTQQHSNVPAPHLIPQQYSQQPASVSQQQFPQKLPTNIQNLQDIEQKTTALAQQQIAPTRDLSHDLSEPRTAQTFQQEKDKSRNNEWNPASTQQNQQPPQIDTWNANDASMGNSGGNQGGNYSRFNRNRSGAGGGGSSGNAKYNNYRSSQQSRSNYNNENGGDSTGGGSSGTFFRNNERYTGDRGGGSNRGYNNDRGNYKQRDGNYRAGSGRFPSGSSAVPPMGASGTRK